jgi:YHS domain-containing protein
MRNFAIALLGTLMICSLAFAEEGMKAAPTAEKAKAHKHEMGKSQEILNNVVKMDAASKRSALCCCGYEFTVTDKAPTMDHEGTSFFMCGEGCKEMAMKASKEENAKTMKDWHKKYDANKLTDNSFLKESKTMATCLCGKTVEVNAKTPKIMENGVTLYLCSDACNTQLHEMSANDRMDAEKKFLASKEPAPKTN